MQKPEAGNGPEQEANAVFPQVLQKLQTKPEKETAPRIQWEMYPRYKWAPATYKEGQGKNPSARIGSQKTVQQFHKK